MAPSRRPRRPFLNRKFSCTTDALPVCNQGWETVAP